MAEEVKLGCTVAMLLCLDSDQRITYILGDVFQPASTDAAYILGISPEAYRKRFSRARGQVRTFVDGWLGFAGSGTSTQAELTTARHLRTGLRALAARNCGQTVDEADLAAAAAWVKRLPVSIQLGSGDSAIIVDGKGATRTLGEVLASYARAVEQGR